MIILRKLVLQNPSALLQATYACSSFGRTAETNPCVWKEAFFGRSDMDLGEQSKDEGIEAHLNSFGGYKRLIEARCGNPMYSKAQQTQDCEALVQNILKVFSPPQLLVLKY